MRPWVGYRLVFCSWLVCEPCQREMQGSPNSFCDLSPRGLHVASVKRKVKVQSLSRVPLCDPMGCSLPDFSVLGILQARIPKWVTIPFSKGSS